MNSYAISQKIEDEYFIKMMIPSIRELAQPFEDEEGTHLRQLMKAIQTPTDYQLVVVGAGPLSYVEMATHFDLDYIAVEPLLNAYLQKQVRFVVERNEHIKCVAKRFGDFDRHLLGVKRNVFAFIFNILGYIQSPIPLINQYISSGDIIFIASWNKSNHVAKNVRDRYFDALNQNYSNNSQYSHSKETMGLCDLDRFDCSRLRHYKEHRRITNQITDILIIHC